jgi:hypothetical protein
LRKTSVNAFHRGKLTLAKAAFAPLAWASQLTGTMQRWKHLKPMARLCSMKYFLGTGLIVLTLLTTSAAAAAEPQATSAREQAPVSGQLSYGAVFELNTLAMTPHAEATVYGIGAFVGVKVRRIIVGVGFDNLKSRFDPDYASGQYDELSSVLTKELRVEGQIVLLQTNDAFADVFALGAYGWSEDIPYRHPRSENLSKSFGPMSGGVGIRLWLHPHLGVSIATGAVVHGGKTEIRGEEENYSSRTLVSMFGRLSITAVGGW